MGPSAQCHQPAFAVLVDSLRQHKRLLCDKIAKQIGIIVSIQDRDRWKHRRRMAYASLIGGLMFPLLMLGSGAGQLTAVAGPFYFFIGAVVGGYIGFATWDDKTKQPARRKEDRESCDNCGQGK